MPISYFKLNIINYIRFELSKVNKIRIGGIRIYIIIYKYITK